MFVPSYQSLFSSFFSQFLPGQTNTHTLVYKALDNPCLRTWRKTVNSCLSLDADDCVRRTSTRV